MKPQRQRQYSAGGLVVRGDQILLIATHSGRWQLPKGHLEPGESAEQAALRETQEETGVRGRVVAPLPGVEYSFLQDGQRIEKRVDYFLLEYESGDAAAGDPREVVGADWFPWEEGLHRLSFESERRVAGAARELVTGAKGGNP